MQLYHHPFDLDSQKVRLAVEEKGIDYTSHHANPITGKNLDSSFFNMKPGGRLPDFQNGSHILCKTIDIIQIISQEKHLPLEGLGGLVLRTAELPRVV
ncbi:hypothetical protein JHK87_011122 [Glycine soja]|nr:hypothetical protein JHK87_011122 [Glycine soja]